MKIKTALSITMAMSFAFSSMALAGRQVVSSSVQSSTATTYTAASTTTTTTMPMSIKEAGEQASAKSGMGKTLGMVAMGVTSAGVMATCFQPTVPQSCYYFAAGLAASIVVTATMGKSSDQSKSTVAAVSTNTDPYNLNNPTGPGSTVSVPADVADDPAWKAAIQTKTKLEKSGWKIDAKNGVITAPSGKQFSTSIASSPEAMAASGASPATIKEFTDAMTKATAKAQEKAKATDNNTSMFADDGGGGGGGGKKGSAETTGGALGFPTMAEAKIGINRDPAQVAGMKKDYNGSPIGVAADSLFDMVDRRYQLHQQNGSFLAP